LLGPRRAGGQSGDTVNQAADTVIGSRNAQVNTVNLVSFDPKRSPWPRDGQHR
jgi:hypothetical protein